MNTSQKTIHPSSSNHSRSSGHSWQKKALILAVVLSAVSGATEFYVSPMGDDTHDGLGPEPGRALRTVQNTVDRLRPGDACILREGTYREKVTFPRNGTADHPIRLVAYPGERPVITGCDLLPGTPKDRGDGIWTVPMPWTLGKGRNQVFLNDRLIIEARHPNEPAPDLGMYVAELSPLWPTFAEFSIPDPVNDPGRIVSELIKGDPPDYWKGACYYGVHYQGWSAQTGIIESSAPGEIHVGDRTRTWWFSSAYKGRYKPEEGRGMIVGHMNALDVPGEWHWEDGVLYFIPPKGLVPEKIEAKWRQLAFNLTDRSYIHIKGIAVSSASMCLADASNCVIDSCNLSYLSHFRRFYSIGQIEDGKDTIKSGETGIYVSGHDNSFLNCTVRYSAGAGFHLRGYHHTIHNCLIDEIDYTSHYLNAVTDAVSDFNNYENELVGGHVITYNTMRNAGRHFFNFYGNGTSRASRDRAPMDYMGTLFAHNHLYNGMLETKDAGFLTGYYSSGGTLNGLNSQVIYNVMHDCYDIFGMRIHKLGIVYLDAGTCDVDLHHNLLWAAPGSHQRGLWYNTACVDIHEHDNVFHKEFEGNSATLRATQFPEGKPFRFGHDTAKPPPLPAWPPLVSKEIPATEFATRKISADNKDSDSLAIASGEALKVGDIDFDAGWQSAVLQFTGKANGMNTDRSARQSPRHKKATDPLVLEAVVNDGTSPEIRRRWTFLHTIRDGNWVCFKDVPLGEGYRRFRVVYGSDSAVPRTLEVHLDSPDGPLAGTIELPQTDRSRDGNVQIYGDATGAVDALATGTRDIYLVLHCPPEEKAGALEYCRFEQYRGRIPLQKNEVKLELRLDAPDGKKIGQFYPKYKAEGTQSGDYVTSLESANDAHALFLVARSDISGTLGEVHHLRLTKSEMPDRIPGTGLAPRRRWWGGMVLPKPTHVPCARPNDKYQAEAKPAVPRGPKPIARASRLSTAPKIDGILDVETCNAAGKLTLSQSWDGSKTPGTLSQAWIGYDATSLYIAFSNPVAKGSNLHDTSHKWGSTDAVEIAFQDGYAEKPGPILNLYGWPDGHMVSTDEAGAPYQAVKRLGNAAEFAAHINGNEWTCEWRIPFDACGFTPESAPMLLLNLGVRKMAEDAWVIWRGTNGATHVVSQAGILAFPETLARRPSSIPARDVLLWLDASKSNSVILDDDGQVSVWEDKSGAERNATQSLPTHRPGFSTDGLNGHPALIFDEKRATRLELPDLSGKRLTTTVFAVFSNPTAGSEVNHHPRILTASDGKEYDYKIGIALNVPGMETGEPRQMMGVFKDRWGKVVRVGCFSPMYQTYFTGMISEIFVVNRELTPIEQDIIRAKLAAKWGLER